MSTPLDDILDGETPPVSDDAGEQTPETVDVAAQPEATDDAQPPEAPDATEEEPKDWSYHAYKDEKTKRKEWETKAQEAEARALAAEQQAQYYEQQQEHLRYQQQDPQGYDVQQFVGQQVSQVEAATRLNMSKMLAVREHGQEKVQAAEQAFWALQGTDPAAFAQISEQFGTDPDPMGRVINWHTKQETLAKLGDDPEAYIEAQVQAKLAALGGVPSGQPNGSAVDTSALPTDLSQSRNVGSRTASNWSGPAPLGDILGD